MVNVGLNIPYMDASGYVFAWVPFQETCQSMFRLFRQRKNTTLIKWTWKFKILKKIKVTWKRQLPGSFKWPFRGWSDFHLDGERVTWKRSLLKEPWISGRWFNKRSRGAGKFTRKFDGLQALDGLDKGWSWDSWYSRYHHIANIS